ncbi:unnamed protein product [Cercopithifilaria johnstoni]|uniref:Uncharacterized protein n=1 Tax=Cercopithifilaria johnstoni TaxID=2874296 RepID=A0A8J2M6R9_9BILA|nr:unnamed protein product [Cercopithifilaria johnstoni]
MTSYEAAEDRIGRTKVTTAFFKKLGEKLRNYQRYQNPVQHSQSSSISSLDLDSNVKASGESISSDRLQTAKKDYTEQIVEKKSKDREKRWQIEKEKNGMKEKLEDIRKVKSQNKQKGKELIGKKEKSSVTDSSKVSENEEPSTTATNTSSKSLAISEKLADEFHGSIKTNFNLGNNNILSILQSKSDPNAIIYDLQNSNGCKIHLEKVNNRAMLLSVDNTGKRLYISCNY